MATPDSTPAATSGAAAHPTASASRFTRIPTAPASASGSTAVPTPVMDAVRAALRAAGVAGEPTVVRSTAVTWPDGSLGCPEPGKSYTQALVPGHEVIVEVGGVTYDVHAGRGVAVVCTRPHGTLTNANA